MSLSDFFKSKETKAKEAEATREAAAEQQLQKILGDPDHLYKLCSALTKEDQAKFYAQCVALKSGKLKFNEADSKMKSSDFLQVVLKGEENAEKREDRLEKLATMNKEVKDLVQQTFTDTNLRGKLSEERKKLHTELVSHMALSKTGSSIALAALIIGITSGRIKDIDQVQKLSLDARVAYDKKKHELGLVVPEQGQGRSGQNR